jgi:hypothetical protein
MLLRLLAHAGVDCQVKVWDVRTFKPLHAYFANSPATSLDISQRGLLAVGQGRRLQVGANPWSSIPRVALWVQALVMVQIWLWVGDFDWLVLSHQHMSSSVGCTKGPPVCQFASDKYACCLPHFRCGGTA